MVKTILRRRDMLDERSRETARDARDSAISRGHRLEKRGGSVKTARFPHGLRQGSVALSGRFP